MLVDTSKEPSCRPTWCAATAPASARSSPRTRRGRWSRPGSTRWRRATPRSAPRCWSAWRSTSTSASPRRSRRSARSAPAVTSAPLAHIASTLIGEGYVLRDGRRVPTGRGAARAGIEPLELRFKEGLAADQRHLGDDRPRRLVWAERSAQVRRPRSSPALVLETLQARPARSSRRARHRPAAPRADRHRRQHAGADGRQRADRGARRPAPAGRKAQQAGDDVSRTDVYMQKAYTLRAIPQVLGAVRDTLYHAADRSRSS